MQKKGKINKDCKEMQMKNSNKAEMHLVARMQKHFGEDSL